ncbi:unnamed protein product, partial [Scytosiphon promiscuus]
FLTSEPRSSPFHRRHFLVFSPNNGMPLSRPSGMPSRSIRSQVEYRCGFSCSCLTFPCNTQTSYRASLQVMSRPPAAYERFEPLASSFSYLNVVEVDFELLQLSSFVFTRDRNFDRVGWRACAPCIPNYPSCFGGVRRVSVVRARQMKVETSAMTSRSNLLALASASAAATTTKTAMCVRCVSQELVGTLRGFDDYVNMVLDDVTEYEIDAD